MLDEVGLWQRPDPAEQRSGLPGADQRQVVLAEDLGDEGRVAGGVTVRDRLDG